MLGTHMATVQTLSGHADVSATVRYDGWGEAARQRVAGVLHVPFEAAE